MESPPDAAEGPHRWAPRVKQAQWLHRAAAPASQPQASQSRVPPSHVAQIWPSSPPPTSRLHFSFKFWVPLEVPRGPNRIKISDVGQRRQTSRLGEVHPVTTEADPSPPYPPPWCIHSPGRHFKGKGEIGKTQIFPALDFRKMDPKRTVWLGKGDESSKWLQPHPFGPLRWFPKAGSSRAVFY